MPGHHKPQLRALTGLRAVVALDVVAYHFGQPYLGGAPEWLRAVVSRGFETVSLFFVLSGFLLAYVYLDDRADRRLDRRAFWVARFARIYPTYLFALVLIAPLTVRELLQAHPASYVLTQAAEVVGLDLPLLQAWLPWAENWNFPAWALSAEACFYLVFPFVGYYVARLSWRGLLLATGAFLALTLASPTLVGALGHALGPGGLALIESSQEWTVKGNPVVNLPAFLAGVALGRLYLLTSVKQAQPRPGARAVRWVLGCVLSTVGIVAALATLTGYPVGVPVGQLWVAAFALLIFGLAHGTGPIAWLLSNPVAVLLGEASYGIYILQLPVLRWTEFAGPSLIGLNPGSELGFAVYLLALVGLSVLTLYVVERPARSAIRRAFARSEAAAP